MRIEKNLIVNSPEAIKAGQAAKKEIQKAIKKTYGVAGKLPSPTAPTLDLSGVPHPGTAPMAPSPAPNPSKIPPPNAPTAIPFSPQPEPNLAPASGIAERAGDFLEKPVNLKSTNNLLKLGALKYALGPAALPVEAGAATAYGAAKLLTAPGGVGEAARMSFKQAGIQAIVSLAQRYPSYHDGILESAQERRSLTKEIGARPELNQVEGGTRRLEPLALQGRDLVGMALDPLTHPGYGEDVSELRLESADLRAPPGADRTATCASSTASTTQSPAVPRPES